VEDQVVGRFSSLVQEFGEDAWEYSTEYEDRHGIFITSQVRFRKQDLKPLSTEKLIDSQKGRIHISAAYEMDKVKICVRTHTKEDCLEIPLSENSFDNEMLLMLLRTLAWEEDVESSLEGIIVDNGQKYFAWLKILQKEETRCALGSFPSWRVTLTFDSGTTQEVWYSVARPHILLKYENVHIRLIIKTYEPMTQETRGEV